MGRGLIVGACAAFVASAVAAALVLSAVVREPAAAPREDAGTFVVRIVGFVVADEYAQAWPSLNPAHQLVARRDEYISCEERTPIGWTLRSADVLRTRQRLRHVPGVAGLLPVTAVTLRMRIRNRALGLSQVFVHTFNAVEDGSHWTWILTPGRYELYRSDGCLA